MNYTFASGVHPSGHKNPTSDATVEEIKAPARVYISLSQHIGAPATATVAKGDRVKIGTMVGRESGFVSGNVFSSVSGTVVGIVDRMTPDGSTRPHVAIENDGLDETEYLRPLTDPSKDEIIARIREAGIVGMGGAGFPTAVKLSPESKADTLIINAAECEPYITCDYRIMLEYTREFLTGVLYLKRALGGVRCMIGVEDNKPEAIHRLNHFMKIEGIEGIEVCVCKTKYPQGAEKQLIYALTKRKVPTGGGLPADVGVIVQNAHTALSAYFAVKEGQPLFRRIMTVTGEGCAHPANLWVRIGTPLDDVIDACGLTVQPEQLKSLRESVKAAEADLKENPKDKAKKSALKEAEAKLSDAQEKSVAKLINGGPMMGLAMQSSEAATTKTTSCLLLYSVREARMPEPSPCISCGKCVTVCPMRIYPNMIESYTRAGDFKGAEKYGAAECIACGCCAYICPAKRPLLLKIAYAKQHILAERKKTAAAEKAKAEARAAEARVREEEERLRAETAETVGKTELFPEEAAPGHGYGSGNAERATKETDGAAQEADASETEKQKDEKEGE